MVKRSASSSLCELDADRRRKVVSDLASTQGVSKTGLATLLNTLNDQGLLNDSLVSSSSIKGYRRQVQHAIEDGPLHAKTPYGIMFQERELPTQAGKSQPIKSARTMPKDILHYIKPLALLHYIASINASLYSLIKDAAKRQGHRLRIVMYIDEINPGNPLAPDPAKLLQAVYWCFLGLPSWFLRRKDSWFCFALIRSKVVHRLEGGVSELMKIILTIFFPAQGDSFRKGCCLSHGSESFMFTASLAGFLADEKALKEIFSIKGQAGNLPCFSCLNVRNRWVNVDGTNLLTHWDPDLIVKRKPNTDVHVAIMVQRLADASKTKREQMERDLGINYAPFGILFCPYLTEHVLKPVRNYIRDWMHTYVSGGVGGTHLALMCQALRGVGCGLDIIQAYAHQITLPRSRGTVSDLYFKKELVATDHVRHFASDVLGMITILHMFLIEKIRPRGWLASNIDCFEALHTIMGILRRAEMTPVIHAALVAATAKHNRLFLELYGNQHAKIKFHHTYHVPDDMLEMGTCLSCFPGERKNKDAKALAIATDRKIERTATISFLHRTITHWSDNANACRPVYLHCARKLMTHGEYFFTSKIATLPCGELHAKDMVLMSDGCIGRVIDFWQRDADDADALVRLDLHSKAASELLFQRASHAQVITTVADIVEPLAWYATSSHIVATS